MPIVILFWVVWVVGGLLLLFKFPDQRPWVAFFLLLVGILGWVALGPLVK